MLRYTMKLGLMPFKYLIHCDATKKVILKEMPTRAPQSGQYMPVGVSSTNGNTTLL